MYVCMYVRMSTHAINIITIIITIMIVTCSSTHAIITSQVHCCTIPHHIAITTAALTIPKQVPNCSMERS